MKLVFNFHFRMVLCKFLKPHVLVTFSKGWVEFCLLLYEAEAASSELKHSTAVKGSD